MRSPFFFYIAIAGCILLQLPTEARLIERVIVICINCKSDIATVKCDNSKMEVNSMQLVKKLTAFLDDYQCRRSCIIHADQINIMCMSVYRFITFFDVKSNI